MVGPISLSPMARAFPNLHVVITTSILLRNGDVSSGLFWRPGLQGTVPVSWGLWVRRSLRVSLCTRRMRRRSAAMLYSIFSSSVCGVRGFSLTCKGMGQAAVPLGEEQQQQAGALHAQSGANSHHHASPKHRRRDQPPMKKQLLPQQKAEPSPALQRPFPYCLCAVSNRVPPASSHCSPCCPRGPVPQRWRTPCRCCNASRCTGLHSSPGCPPGRGNSTPESWLCSPGTHIPPRTPGQSQPKTMNTWD